jgi:Domain of unknown function (DUF4158)
MAASFLTAAQRERYGHYPDLVTPEDLSRCFHLSDDDQEICKHDEPESKTVLNSGSNHAGDRTGYVVRVSRANAKVRLRICRREADVTPAEATPPTGRILAE